MNGDLDVLLTSTSRELVGEIGVHPSDFEFDFDGYGWCRWPRPELKVRRPFRA